MLAKFPLGNDKNSGSGYPDHTDDGNEAKPDKTRDVYSDAERQAKGERGERGPSGTKWSKLNRLLYELPFIQAAVKSICIGELPDVLSKLF